MKKRIAVIGAGNGGFAMAGDLTHAGFEINLFEFPQFEENIVSVREKGGIEINGNARTGFAKINLITTDLKEAIENCYIIMIVTQTAAQEELAHMLVPLVKPDQSIFFLPGSAGSILIGKIFHEKGVSPKVGIAETVTLPYACRKSGKTSVDVLWRTGNLGISAFPSKNIDNIFPIFQEIYPSCYKMGNALEVGICNTNFIAHPVVAILSLSRIEYSRGDFNFYEEGCTPSVEKVIDAVDQEIGVILKTLGFPAKSSKAACEKRFGMTWDKIQNDIRKKWVIKGAEKRFMTEDVQVGLILISSIGKQFGIPTPTCDSIIHLCEVVEEVDYWKTGRTMKELGLDKMNKQELKKFLKNGYR